MCAGPGVAPAFGDSLVAHWSFNDETDPCHDDSGNGHDCTPLGPIWVHGAFCFDGLDDVIEAFTTPDELAQSFETYTVHVRFKSDDFSQGILIMRQEPPGGSHADNFHIRPKDDGSGRALGTHEYNCCQNCYVYSKEDALLGDGEWHTLDLTYDGEILRLYRDRCLDDEIACGEPAYAEYTPSKITIGANPGLTNFFTGCIDDVKIYDYALSPEPVPTVSQWGLIVMTLLLLTGTKIYFGRRWTT